MTDAIRPYTPARAYSDSSDEPTTCSTSSTQKAAPMTTAERNSFRERAEETTREPPFGALGTAVATKPSGEDCETTFTVASLLGCGVGCAIATRHPLPAALCSISCGAGGWAFSEAVCSETQAVPSNECRQDPYDAYHPGVLCPPPPPQPCDPAGASCLLSEDE